MKRIRLALLRPVLLLILCAGLSPLLQAQLTKRSNTAMPGANVNGFLEWLPNGYATNTSTRYPLIIYIGGLNWHGSGSDADLEKMFTGSGTPHEQQRGGTWVDEYTVNGQSHRFVIITPQFLRDYNAGNPTAEELDAVVAYALANYRIDPSRVYIMGQSQGGGIVWDYISAGTRYGNSIAAAIPFSGVIWPDRRKANVVKNNNTAVWAFHNQFDAQVPTWFTTDMVRMVNEPPAPSVPARQTIFPGETGHISWFNPLTRAYAEGGMNIYQWLLTQQKPATTAYAGPDQEVDLPTVSVQLAGSGTTPTGNSGSFGWSQVAGPTTATFSSTSVSNPTVSNLGAGTYIFRLTVSGTGGSATDHVAVVVNPQPIHVEAENYTAMSGVEKTSQVVNYFDPGDWVEYTVNIPQAGTYNLRFRTATPNHRAALNISNTSGTVLSSVNVFNTGWWSNWITENNRSVNLPAGTQTLRITAVTEAFDFDWFELVRASAIEDIPLPVSFVHFSAACSDEAVQLQWKTGYEENARHFAVEKSTDGRTWSVIATIPAAGRSTTEQHYSYKDPAGATNSWYRIVEYDLDGKKTTSTVKRPDCAVQATFRLYPNPVSDKAMLEIHVQQPTRLQLSVVDSKGAVVRRQESNLSEGYSQLTIDMNGLAKGSYTILARWGGESKSIKVIKK